MDSEHPSQSAHLFSLIHPAHSAHWIIEHFRILLRTAKIQIKLHLWTVLSLASLLASRKTLLLMAQRTLWLDARSWPLRLCAQRRLGSACAFAGWSEPSLSADRINSYLRLSTNRETLIRLRMHRLVYAFTVCPWLFSNVMLRCCRDLVPTVTLQNLTKVRKLFVCDAYVCLQGKKKGTVYPLTVTSQY